MSVISAASKYTPKTMAVKTAASQDLPGSFAFNMMVITVPVTAFLLFISSDTTRLHHLRQGEVISGPGFL